MSNEGAVDDYWRLVLRAMVEADPSTALCYSDLQVGGHLMKLSVHQP